MTEPYQEWIAEVCRAHAEKIIATVRMARKLTQAELDRAFNEAAEEFRKRISPATGEPS